jgi:hypothetical protein
VTETAPSASGTGPDWLRDREVTLAHQPVERRAAVRAQQREQIPTRTLAVGQDQDPAIAQVQAGGLRALQRGARAFRLSQSHGIPPWHGCDAEASAWMCAFDDKGDGTAR